MPQRPPRSALAAVPPGRRLDRGVVLFPDEVLTRPSADVVEFGPVLNDFGERLKATMRVHNARGVAACQLGIPARMFVFLNAGVEQLVVNPVVSDEMGRQRGDEACLSLPGALVQVERAAMLHLSGRTIDDEPFELDVTDLLTSAAVQHEMDHLDGIMVIDRVTRQQRRQALRRAGVAA